MTLRAVWRIALGMMGQVGKRRGGDPGAAFPFPPFGSQRGGRMQDQAGGDPSPSGAGVLDRALAVFDRAAVELGEALARLRAEGVAGDGSGRALRAVRELQMALAVCLDERVKGDRLRNEVAGVVGERALDLDAARVEIGRRLARLRDAGGGD